MHREYYFLGIILCSLIIIEILFNGYIFSKIGYQLFQLESFARWYWIIVALEIFSALIFVKYYTFKGYSMVYYAAVISIFIGIIQSITSYLFIIQMMREIMPFYLAILMISMLVGFYYAFTLVISKAKEQIWLRVEGYLLLFIFAVSAVHFIWSMNWLGFQQNQYLEIAQQWLIFGGVLLPIPLVLLFYKESKSLSPEQKAAGKLKYEEIMYAFCGLLFMAGLVIATRMSNQMYWFSHISPEEQALVDKFEQKTYEGGNGKTLDYLFIKPLDYDSTIQYPLVICLHGGPQSVKSKRVIVTQPAPLLINAENREKYPAFIFVPQAGPARSWGGMPFAQSIDSLLMDAIQALEEAFSIDRKRIYLTGISMGGYGTWYLLGTRPDKFAAAIPMCGAGDPKMATEMIHTPIWAFHGSKDKNVPVSGSRAMIDAIEKAGGYPKYTEFPEVAHHVWPHVEDTPGVLDWLFDQEKLE